MKLRLVGMALLFGASVSAYADAEHDGIASDRSAANAKLAAQERECADRFVVAPCLEDARTEHRATLARLRQQELQLDEGRRRAAAEARRKSIAEKAEAQQARASDPAPEAPRVRVRSAPQPTTAPASRKPDDGVLPTPATGDAPKRNSIEQRNRQKFEDRQRQAQSHRDAVARRNAERAAKGKVAAPLPQGGASAAR